MKTFLLYLNTKLFLTRDIFALNYWKGKAGHLFRVNDGVIIEPDFR